jgi:ribose-phosphate pyrophosphokinase
MKIFLNNQLVEFARFPNDELNFNDPGFRAQTMESLYIKRRCDVKVYDFDTGALFPLIALTEYLRDLLEIKLKFTLILPYLPYSRMDRKVKQNDFFMLQTFARVINSLKYDEVYTLCAHSDVGPALINNCINDMSFHRDHLERSRRLRAEDILIFPDATACKRYDSIDHPNKIYCNKKRDWETGELTGVTCHILDDLRASEIPRTAHILDDLCSYGGTFQLVMDEINKYYPNNNLQYVLVVPHTEAAIEQGGLLDRPDLLSVYTSDSMGVNYTHEKIKILANI